MTDPLQPPSKQDADPERSDSELMRELESLRHALAMSQQQRETERKHYEQDLHQARHELAQARLIEEELSERLHKLQSAGSDLIQMKAVVPGQVVRASLWRRIWNLAFVHGEKRRLQNDLKLLQRSELFDASWYLAEYPDVADSHVDPVEHYLRFGAHEGRDPGPLFQSDAYLRDHPELAEGRINPLVHYLRSRQDMGR